MLPSASAVMPEAPEIRFTSASARSGSGMKARSEPSRALPTVMPRTYPGFKRRIRHRVAHVERVVRRHVQRARPAELRPRGDEVAVLVENLHPVVAAVGHVHVPAGAADGDVVGLVELAGIRSGAAPRLDEAAVLRELHDPVVSAVAVRHEDVAVGRNRHAGRPTERVRTVPGHAGPADRHQHLARGTQLEHLVAHRLAREGAGRCAGGHPEHRLVTVRVGRPQVSLRVDGEAVREGEHPAAQARQQPPGRRELQNRRVGAPDAGGRARGHGVEAAVEDPDVAVGVQLRADQLAPLAAVHLRRQRRPSSPPAGTGSGAGAARCPGRARTAPPCTPRQAPPCRARCRGSRRRSSGRDQVRADGNIISRTGSGSFPIPSGQSRAER